MAINTLLELQKYRLPIDFNDNNNVAGVIISNIIKEKNIAKQQAPFDNTIFAKIQQLALDSNKSNSDCSILSDIVALGLVNTLAPK